MYIPTQYLQVGTNKPKPVKRSAVALEKSDSNPNSANQALHVQAPQYDKREGEERRKRNLKPLLDTRTGKDRRFNKDRPSIDIKA